MWWSKEPVDDNYRTEGEDGPLDCPKAEREMKHTEQLYLSDGKSTVEIGV